jgi:hypothetical protein
MESLGRESVRSANHCESELKANDETRCSGDSVSLTLQIIII